MTSTPDNPSADNTANLRNPLRDRMRYRLHLQEVVYTVVGSGVPLAHALDILGHTVVSAPGLVELVQEELAHLSEYNCARYRLTGERTKAWIAAGRPL